MAIHIQPYTDDLRGAVAEFNRRMRPAKVPFEVPETTLASWLPKIDGRDIHQEIFLAVEDEIVRGAYTFKQQQFSFWGRIVWLGACQMPVSEGIIDARYSLVGPKIVNDALRRQPLLYGLGIGSREAAVTRLLQAMGWHLTVVPFFFKVRHGFSFFRNIQYLRTTRLRQLLLDAVAYSGLAAAAARVAGTKRSTGQNPRRPILLEPFTEFSGWADRLWKSCADRYSMIAVRDAGVLNILYPPSNLRFIKLKILDGSRIAGWAVLLDTQMSQDRYFGNMRVGSIVDCLSAPEDAMHVVRTATRFLEKRGVDLVLSNQSHSAWGRALRNAGFMAGPSNFYFITSKPLTALLNQVDEPRSQIHLNRGDGDGPIHL